MTLPVNKLFDAVICLGSNVPEQETIINQVLELLCKHGKIIAKSNFYIMPSYSGIGNDYLNIVIVLRTDLMLDQLVNKTKRIEVLCGRLPSAKISGIMPIDIDVVVYDHCIVDELDFFRAHFTVGYNNLIAGR